jgi:hypothetical protein
MGFVTIDGKLIHTSQLPCLIVTKDEIIRIVCEVCEIELNDLKSNSIKRRVAIARHIAAYRLYWDLRLSLRDSAEAVGYSPTACYRYIRPSKLRARKENDALFRELWAEADNRLKNLHPKKSGGGSL